MVQAPFRLSLGGEDPMGHHLLGVGARKYRIRVRWRHALAILAALACCLALAAPASAATTPTAVEICGQGPAVVRPASMILTCADNGELAKNLHWTSWTSAKATATGTVTWRACTAKCAD